MKQIRKSLILLGMLLLANGYCQNASATVAQEASLKHAQIEIDTHAAIWSNEKHAQTLGDHFKVPATTIQTLSAKNQGWGAVNIELSMATQISQLHTLAYPMVTASLEAVEKMRAGGSSWGKIAKTMEFELGPVIKETRDMAKKLRDNDLAAARRKHEAAKVAASQKTIQEDHQILKAEEDKKPK